MLEIQSLSVRYNSHPILNEITIQLRKGEVMALIGANGAGKTTLIRAISGVVRPSAGQVRLEGVGLESLTYSQRARYIAVVPQARDLPGNFSVRQTVALGRTPYLGWSGQASARDRARVDWALERTHLKDLAERPVDTLSGGEQQRVLLGRALAQEAPILLMDEPTAHLDLRHQAGILGLAQDLAREQGLAVLMALHDLNLASLYAERVALLVEGRLHALGTPAEVLTPAHLMAAYQVPLHVIPHPDYGAPLVLPDGRR